MPRSEARPSARSPEAPAARHRLAVALDRPGARPPGVRHPPGELDRRPGRSGSPSSVRPSCSPGAPRSSSSTSPPGSPLAVLALIAVLPEYAVDFVVHVEGRRRTRTSTRPLALANMTGGNRLLIGIGWSMVVLLAAWRMKTHRQAPGLHRAARRRGRSSTGRTRSRSRSSSLATVYSLTLPLKRSLTLVRLRRADRPLRRLPRAASPARPPRTPHLVGPAELIGAARRSVQRRIVVGLMLAFAAGVILASAERVRRGAGRRPARQFGIDEFLLVQWLAPLASEAPELLDRRAVRVAAQHRTPRSARSCRRR